MIGIRFGFDFTLGQLQHADRAAAIYWYSVPATAKEGDTVTLDALAYQHHGQQPATAATSGPIHYNGQVHATGSRGQCRP